MNEEDGNGNLMGDVNCVLCDFGDGWKRSEKELGLGGGVLVLGHLCPKKWGPAKSCYLNRGVLPTH